MDFDLRPIGQALVGFALILGTVGAVWAALGRGPRRKLALVAAPMLGVSLLAVVALQRIAAFVGIVCVMGGAIFAVIAMRARRALLATAASQPIPASDAMARLDRGDGTEVALHGKVEADPPLVAPISGVPCLSYRLELFRKAAAGEELVALEEQACDRVVMSDASGRVALSADPRGLLAAGVPVAEVSTAGELGTGIADPRLQRAIRHLSPNAPADGATYRVTERAVQNGTPMTAVGRMVRRAGEPVLVPTLAARVSLTFDGDASRNYRRLMFACATLAALSVGLGFALLSVPRDTTAETSAP